MDRTKDDIDATTDEIQSDINKDRHASTITKTSTTIQKTSQATKSIISIERQRATSSSTPFIRKNQIVKTSLLKIGHTKKNLANNNQTEKAQVVQSKEKKTANNLLKIANTRGCTVLKEIKRLQQSTKLVIPKAPFLRFVTFYIFSNN